MAPLGAKLAGMALMSSPVMALGSKYALLQAQIGSAITGIAAWIKGAGGIAGALRLGASNLGAYLQGSALGGWIASMGSTIGGWFSAGWAAFKGTALGGWIASTGSKIGGWFAAVYGGQSFLGLLSGSFLTTIFVEAYHGVFGDGFDGMRAIGTFITTMAMGPVGVWSWNAIKAGVTGWLPRIGIWTGFSMGSGAIYTIMGDGGIGTFIVATLVSAALFPAFGWLGGLLSGPIWSGLVSATDNIAQSKVVQWIIKQSKKAYNGFRTFVSYAGQYAGQKYNET